MLKLEHSLMMPVVRLICICVLVCVCTCALVRAYCCAINMFNATAFTCTNANLGVVYALYVLDFSLSATDFDVISSVRTAYIHIHFRVRPIWLPVNFSSTLRPAFAFWTELFC